jgi:hypothetical protein
MLSFLVSPLPDACSVEVAAELVSGACVRDVGTGDSATRET